MENILQRSPRFVYRVFTDNERAYCEGHHRPAVRYATHFAAKEAVLKALGTGFADGIAFTDVEVTHDEKGKPLALLHGRAQQIASMLGILEIPLSLSRTNETAVANAIAVTAATRPGRRGEDDTCPGARDAFSRAAQHARRPRERRRPGLWGGGR